MSSTPPKQSWMTTFGWAAYLACSWTWCIGMFLPVLLVRDFGIWGFVVFAVPNVIGAGGMGWVLRDASGALRVVQAHAAAVRGFSEVTWAFHLFFLVWLLTSNQAIGWVVIGVVIAAVVAGMLILNRVPSPRSDWIAAAATWLISVSILAWLGVRGDLHLPNATPSLDATHLIWLAPVCAFGFLLCPYLDVTFLHARANQSRAGSRWSFLLGFGGLFSVMIVFTLLYARLFSREGNPIALLNMKGMAAALMFAHIVQQIAFTNSVHGSAGREHLKHTDDGSRRGAAAGLLIVMCTALLNLGQDFTIHGLTVGEVLYRLFMSFYGLVFPAYVWLCMIPFRGERGTQSPSRIKLIVLGVAVTLAAPCYWMGFIERQTWWLAPGLGIVLLARPVLAVLVRRDAPRTP